MGDLSPSQQAWSRFVQLFTPLIYFQPGSSQRRRRQQGKSTFRLQHRWRRAKFRVCGLRPEAVLITIPERQSATALGRADGPTDLIASKPGMSDT